MELHDLSLLLSTLKMALQVCLSLSYQSIIYQHVPHTAVADGDYEPVSSDLIQFNRGDVNKTHTISIDPDEECEDPSEFFFSNIKISTGIPTINVTIPQAKIIIEDRSEPECGKQPKT